ncbi:MAG TPA: hybrid sensor histidine kinase/response regulator, partial [Cyanobacteria bacterium UBA8543]|nr:hybrid sensor histidine kinase/response regulator [Cyanobacteria bacterium UBA8543]
MQVVGFKRFRKVPLRLVLVVPFVLQISAAVGLVGYLSFKNSQQAVNDLAHQLMSRVSGLVDQHLDSYLTAPHQINQLNANAIELGQLNLQDFPSLGRHFWKQMHVFNIGYIAYLSKQDGYAAAGYFLDPKRVIIDELSQRTKGKTYTYTTDNQGNRTSVQYIDETYDPQTEAAYLDAVKAGKPVWSKIYSWDNFPQILSIAASYPIYNNNKTLLGVLSADLRLSQISSFLRKLTVSKSEKTFILERNGLLVASSSKEEPFKIVKGKAQRVNASNSSDRLIRATAQFLHTKFGSL